MLTPCFPGESEHSHLRIPFEDSYFIDPHICKILFTMQGIIFTGIEY